MCQSLFSFFTILYRFLLYQNQYLQLVTRFHNDVEFMLKLNPRWEFRYGLHIHERRIYQQIVRRLKQCGGSTLLLFLHYKFLKTIRLLNQFTGTDSQRPSVNFAKLNNLKLSKRIKYFCIMSEIKSKQSQLTKNLDVRLAIARRQQLVDCVGILS